VQLAVWTPKHGSYLAASRCEAAVMAHPQVEWCPDHGYHIAAVAAPASKLLRLHWTGTWALKHGQAAGTRLGSGSYLHKLLSNQLHVPLRPWHFRILCRHLRILCHPLPNTKQLGGYNKLHRSCLYGRLLWYPGERFKLRWIIFHLQGFRKVNASPPKQLQFILHTTNKFKCLAL
jgi:hypothetical protein